VTVATLPSPPQASQPPEVRGRGREDVAMLVASRADGSLANVRFRELPRFLDPGDLLVVNNSATLPAALAAEVDGRAVELHLSTPLADGGWVVELRTAELLPLRRPSVGTRLELPGGGHAQLLAPYLGSDRLGVARLSIGEEVGDYLERHGRPIRYGHVDGDWPLSAYQTIFASDPGSAEMPSAGRPFSTELVTELVGRGILFAPVTLHTGVSSLERGEMPYPERYRVPAATARVVNAVRSWGGRVIAVGTTVVRALETMAGPDGTVAPGGGSTPLVVTPERGLHAVDGLLTGWHEADSSHLQLLEAATGTQLLGDSYRAAGARGYLGHEFGDVNLILP
jgi:S-adenosylmethionine:tRNA ribosyltransferase-isomerase